MKLCKLLLLAAVSLRADQVVLKNNDRITGAIVTADQRTIIMKTDAMGEIKIDRAAVASISTDQALSVTLKGGDRLVGTVTADKGQVEVRKADFIVVSRSQGELEAMRNAVAQKAWEREQLRVRHPPLHDFWSGDIALNLASASGNAKTTTFGTGATAQRVTGFDKIGLSYNQIYSTQSTVIPFGATANRISGGLRYDRNVSTRLFGFGFTSFDYDKFQDLDLRSVLGAGLGVHAYKTDRHKWDLGAGGAWNREAFGTGLVRKSGEVVLSEESTHQLTAILSLFQKTGAFPNVSERGDYRLNIDAGLSLKLTKMISWNVNASDRYLSNPLPGRKTNDVILTTGIGVRFEQK